MIGSSHCCSQNCKKFPECALADITDNHQSEPIQIIDYGSHGSITYSSLDQAYYGTFDCGELGDYKLFIKKE